MLAEAVRKLAPESFDSHLTALEVCLSLLRGGHGDSSRFVPRVGASACAGECPAEEHT